MIVINRTMRMLWHGQAIGKIGKRQHRAISKYHGAFNQIFEFAHIAWPVMGADVVAEFAIEAGDALAEFRVVFFDKVIRQQVNILRPLA